MATVEAGQRRAVDAAHRQAAAAGLAEQGLHQHRHLVADRDAEAFGQYRTEQYPAARFEIAPGGQLAGNQGHLCLGRRIDPGQHHRRAPGRRAQQPRRPQAQTGRRLRAAVQERDHPLRIAQRLQAGQTLAAAGGHHLQGRRVELHGAGDHLPVQAGFEPLEDDQAEEAEGDRRHGQQRTPRAAPDVAHRQAEKQHQLLHAPSGLRAVKNETSP